ncbi:MAG TPA: chromosomal replication initiator DnaA, partial [Allosphingosinicella sp.]|nr:chromosomal replication initiator DnaA [Allosphingosinicella sp.]
APDDALIGQLIVKLLGDRGIAVPPDVPAFLVPRIERSHIALLAIVDVLDSAMLSHHRRMTVAMAKMALEETGMIGRAKDRG